MVLHMAMLCTLVSIVFGSAHSCGCVVLFGQPFEYYYNTVYTLWLGEGVVWRGRGLGTL